MGHSDNSALSGTDGPAGSEGGAPVSPVRAFLLLLALLVLAGLVLWVTTRPDRAEPIRMERPEATGETRSSQTQAESRPNERPTKAEAKKIFRELQGLVRKATKKRDVSILSEALAPRGTSFKPASEAIRRLLKDNVMDETTFRSIRLQVLKTRAKGIEVKEKRRLTPCFVTEQGVDVTQGPPAVKQVTLWLLHRFGQEWLIESAAVESQRVLRAATRACP